MFRNAKYRWARWFFGRPALPFALQVVALAPLVLADDIRGTLAVYAFALPWLLPFFGILNLPFLAGAFRSFRLDPATKRNHALEHATILVLETRAGRRFNGRSTRNGFRLSGNASIDEVRKAFDRVRRTIKVGEELVYVTPRCGSNIATALGLGVVLLALVTLGSVLLQPSVWVRGCALAAVALTFVGLRRSVGNALQRRYFTSSDFTDVAARDIRPARRELFDIGPAHFVETIVWPKSRVDAEHRRRD